MRPLPPRRLPGLALCLALIGCEGEPPSISGVEPSAGPPGTEVTVRGDHLTDSTTVRFGGTPLEAPTVVDAHTLTGTVPADLGPGPVDLVVSDASGRQMTRTKAFIVEASAPPEHPCRSTEKRFTAIPPDGSVVKIDRHLAGGEVERTSFSTRQIAAIELRSMPLPEAAAPAEAPAPAEPAAAPAEAVPATNAGSAASPDAAAAVPTCSTIYLLLEGDGGRVLFDSDDTVDLKAQAQKIAQGLGKRLVMAEGPPE